MPISLKCYAAQNTEIGAFKAGTHSYAPPTPTKITVKIFGFCCLYLEALKHLPWYVCMYSTIMHALGTK